MLYPWLHRYYRSVTNTWQQGLLPHALFLTGLEGVGIHALANAITEFVLCEDKQGNNACGHCRSCSLSHAGNHPDWISVGLEDKSKSLKVEQIRQLSRQLNQTPFGHYQVVIINPACKMNLAAANALLKTLEEPAGSVLLMLVAHDWLNLPATVMSRCQRIHVSINDSELALNWLRDAFPDQNSSLLWGHTQGAPLLAESLLEQKYFGFRDEVLNCLEQAAFNHVNPLPAISNWLKSEISLIVRILFMLTIDCIKLAMLSEKVELSNQDQYVRMVKLSSAVANHQWFDLYSELLEVRSTLLTGIAVNKQLLLERLMLSWLGMSR
jgi:DNA polymerase III subunit delta'